MIIEMRRGFMFISGLLIMTLGTVIMIESDIGLAAYDALCIGGANKLGVTSGNVYMLLGIIIVCVNAVVQKEMPNVFSWITSILVGIGVNFWMNVVSLNQHIYVKYVWFVVGMVVSSFGIALYVLADLAKGPIDQLMLNISAVLKGRTWAGKTIMELFFLWVAFVIKGPIGVGTVIVTFASGFFIDIFIRCIERRKEK